MLFYAYALLRLRLSIVLGHKLLKMIMFSLAQFALRARIFCCGPAMGLPSRTADIVRQLERYLLAWSGAGTAARHPPLLVNLRAIWQEKEPCVCPHCRQLL